MIAFAISRESTQMSTSVRHQSSVVADGLAATLHMDNAAVAYVGLCRSLSINSSGQNVPSACSLEPLHGRL